MADNTVKPEGSTSASGAVLAQAGIDSSNVNVEEQVAAKEPKPEDSSSTVVADDKQEASADTTTKPETNAKEEDNKTNDASPSDRKRKHSNDDSSNFRERRDRFQKGDEYRDHNRSSNNRGRGNNRGNNNRYQNNSKSHYEDLPETDDPDQIRKQVEFYFSDSNLLQDAYLLKAVDGPRNNAVSVKMIHSFKRMRHFQPYSAVVAALKESSTLDITGTEGNEEIVRKTPLPEEVSTNARSNRTFFEDKTIPRSIYAKGFPEETATTQTDIEAFFAPYGPVNAVRLRRNDDREFKRSVFVEFDSEETQKAFLELETKPKFGEKELQIQSKGEYVEGKKKLIDEGVIRASSPRGGGGRDDRDGRSGGRGGRGGRGRGRGNGRGRGRGGNDRNRSRERRDRDDDRSRSPRRSDRRRDDRDGGAQLSEDKPVRYVRNLE